MVKKRAKKTSKRLKKTKNTPYLDLKNKKISTLVNNLLLFLGLALISLILAGVLSNSFFISLFSVLTIIFGLISLAFLITFLVLILLHALSKNKS